MKLASNPKTQEQGAERPMSKYARFRGLREKVLLYARHDKKILKYPFLYFLGHWIQIQSYFSMLVSPAGHQKILQDHSEVIWDETVIYRILYGPKIEIIHSHIFWIT